MLIYWYLLWIILGALLGSFLNAWIWRTREGTSIGSGRSKCPNCHHTLGFFDLFPIVSFIVLKGSCRYCKKTISWQYPLIEAVTAALFLLLAYIYRDVAFTWNSEMLRDAAILFFLVFIFVYDFLYMEIWDHATTIPGAVLFFFSLMFGWNTWQSMVLGILIGAGFFWLQYVVSRGKWIGGGDIRLGFFMGVILGYPLIILALLIAYVFGAIVSVILIAMKRKKLAGETPFGTYLTVATVIVMFFGQEIIQWYLGLIGF